MKDLLRETIEKEEDTSRKALMQYLMDFLELDLRDAEDLVRLLDKWLIWRELNNSCDQNDLKLRV